MSVARPSGLVGSCLKKKKKRRQVGPFLLPQVSDESAGMFPKPACQQTSLYISANSGLITLNLEPQDVSLLLGDVSMDAFLTHCSFQPVVLLSAAAVCGDAVTLQAGHVSSTSDRDGKLVQLLVEVDQRRLSCCGFSVFITIKFRLISCDICQLCYCDFKESKSSFCLSVISVLLKWKHPFIQPASPQSWSSQRLSHTLTHSQQPLSSFTAGFFFYATI